jgi:drug/metabolite transporter (DMT)-like permease
VKGRAGPTIAIIYTGCFFTIALQAIILAQIPTLEQFSAAILAFSGVLILIYGKETHK